MLEFLGFRRSKNTKIDTLKPTAVVATPGAPTGNSLQREMVRLALSSVLGRQGIATQWLGCEVLPMPRPQTTDVVCVLLVILKWHEGFMRYAPELEAEVFKEIQLFDKTRVAADFVFVWKFAADCGHPSDKLPAPEYWSKSPEAKAAEALVNPTQIVDSPNPTSAATKFDLPKSNLDFGDTNRDFAITQIEAFR